MFGIVRPLARLSQRFSGSLLQLARPTGLSKQLSMQWKSPGTVRISPRVPFSTTLRRVKELSETGVDEELSAKLESELQLEKQIKDYDGYPESVKDYIENGPFKILDIAGQEEVVLIRDFNGETIRVSFAISDYNNMDEDFDPESPESSEAEDLVSFDSGPESSPQRSASKKPSDSLGHAIAGDDAAGDEEDFGPGFPVRLHITIEKANAGTLQIGGVVQDGMVAFENVSFHKDNKVATMPSAQTDWESKGVYAGPPFGNLDEDLQVLLERYLDDRGINTALALFVPDYIDFKEQREYLDWLQNIKGFVDS